MNRGISIAVVLLILAGLIYWAFDGKDIHSSLGKSENAIPGPKDHASWHEYTAPGDQFTVLLPVLPHTAKEELVDPKSNEKRNYQIFVSTKDDGTIFSVYMISFSEKLGEKYDDAFLENFMKEMLKSNDKTRVHDVKLVKYGPGKALEFNLETSEAAVFGKAFLSGQTLYILSQTTKPEQKNPNDFDFFANSFKLMQKTEHSDTINKK
jgi:hypothetical protein